MLLEELKVEDTQQKCEKIMLYETKKIKEDPKWKIIKYIHE